MPPSTTLPELSYHEAFPNFEQHDAVALLADQLLQVSTSWSQTGTIFARAVESQADAMGLGGHLTDPGAILKLKEKQNIQIMSVVAAAFSLVLCLITMYWFIMMRRTFRRTIVMLLIVADFWKAFWFLVFPAVSLGVGQIPTSSPFCQAGGFFVQSTLEAVDTAIFLMSLHMYLQIFNTKQGGAGQDGLYRWRYWVYAAWLIVPNIMAALAFVNTDAGSAAYISQGALCSLPIRPFWYRLALSWIPRYLVWLFVVFVVLRIYYHVGKGFGIFRRQNSNSSTAGKYTISRGTDPNATILPRRRGSTQMLAQQNLSSSETSTIEEGTSAENVGQKDSAAESLVNSDDNTRTAARKRYTLDKPVDTPLGSPGEDAAHPVRGESVSSTFDFENQQHSQLHNVLSPIDENQGSGEKQKANRRSKDAGAARNEEEANKRGRAILRQVRLLFIYPVVYALFMALPFVNHCFSYSNYYAAHPIYIISALATFCFAFMGAADCLVFSLREKPWLHIPGSDGTILGSFCFWRFGVDFELSAHLHRRHHDAETPAGGAAGVAVPRPQMAASASYRKRPAIPSRVFSGTSDREALAAEQAAQRLALERQDAAMRTSSYGPEAVSDRRPSETKETKEWFDRRESWFDDRMNESDEFDAEPEAEATRDEEKGGFAST